MSYGWMRCLTPASDKWKWVYGIMNLQTKPPCTKPDATTLAWCNGSYKRVADKKTIKGGKGTGIVKTKMWVFLTFPEANRKIKIFLLNLLHSLQAIVWK